ncbi:MAG: hypothetical protein K9N47_06225 [Prosthecobacter sp.]|uniref:hypothetical protein n=1 Tax=Prosthecobacter sp. TaxID=1965333 RepID=UPI0025FBC04F|nr:hypothetical protein [Prosthecobacter sp.]MCF7785698.1 hypothetical protein [Prosthecobacter sp.]
MKFLRHLCLPLLLGLSSCTYIENKLGGLAPKKSSKDKRVGEAKVIGVIELVNPEQNYVLINCERRVDIPAGSEIISQGVNGTDAKLRVTPERKGNYITADITQGTPQVRDLVLYQVKRDEQPAATTMTASGAIVPLAPVMQADVIPPLDAPFQPMAPVQPSFVPAPTAPPPLRQAPQSPAPPPAEEPAADLSKLPPVIR